MTINSAMGSGSEYRFRRRQTRRLRHRGCAKKRASMSGKSGRIRMPKRRKLAISRVLDLALAGTVNDRACWPGSCFRLAGGAIAQLGERVVRNDEVGGSIPPGSTMFLGYAWHCPKATTKHRESAPSALNFRHRPEHDPARHETQEKRDQSHAKPRQCDLLVGLQGAIACLCDI